MKKRFEFKVFTKIRNHNQFAAWLILFLITLQLSGCSAFGPGKADQEQTVVKSQYDKRSYRSVRLKNRLRVLLISDPETDQAAAAMDVAVGQFSDPLDRQGLAHFLEHMLFLGTYKFPDSDAYGSYLSSHGGSSNAFTSLEDTNYFFSINKDYLEGALDRFSQFFISPRFDAEFAEREINAVNSEHQKNINSDDRRIYQILRNTANADHPFHMFGTGNLKSLKGGAEKDGQLREQLILFYENHYSANLMKLVILGKEPLDELEQMASTYFAAVPDRDILPDRFTGKPVIQTPLGRKISILPVKSIRQLKLMFPVPSQRSNYSYKTATLLTQLLGDEGKGSILALLKRQGLATSLSAGLGPESRDFGFINISIGLIPAGLKQTDSIITSVFQYLERMKQEATLERYFHEFRKIAAVEFRFKEKEQPSNYVSRLAMSMQDVPIQHVLVAPWLYQSYRPALTEELLQYLTPENMQVVLAAEGGAVDQTDPWYGTQYGVQKIPSGQLVRWGAVRPQPDLSLPSPNPFIAENVEFQPGQSIDATPVLIRHSARTRIWFKQDSVFKVPKGNLRIRLSTLDAYASVQNAAMTKLFALLLRERLNEYAYPAALAGLYYSLSNSTRGIELSLSGYSENIGILFKKVIEEIKRGEIDEKRFEILKHQMAESRQNSKLGQAYRRVGYEMAHLLSNPLWHTDEYLAVIDGISVQDLAAFTPTLLSNLHIDFLAHGNFKTSEILEMAVYLEESLKGAGSVTLPTERTIVVPAGDPLVYQFKVSDVNSAIEMYYQVGPETIRQSITLDMIQQMIEKPFYHQLRTLEQLGYIVWSGHQVSGKVDGFMFIIQSNVKDPVYLQKRIEQFLAEFEDRLEQFSEEEFNEFREALIARRRETPKNLQEETHRYWQAISSGSYDFQSRESEIQALLTLTPAEVRDLFREVFIKPKSVKKISVQAVGKRHQKAKPQGRIISNPERFKKKMNFYPNPEGEISQKSSVASR